ncbi:Copper chaperone CopZ [Chitinophaga sp. YR627]|jgi:copper chaperone CopZ|uniref:heavy metal transport/detoxification protein n=1 Tax=Chitinophaga sp. YR627 TaxID=1881041 RepID=UPI0008E57A79|nr:heavy metal transport/detoxification protein [Chitinophaga sp. YR627]SFM68791.1 Copper chaperone CopZ [Chitinophaga sp. YR627]
MEQQFKTNIKCGGCIATVTPFLNEAAGENTWKVDTAAPEKILTVSADAVSAAAIISAVEKAGYKAAQL